jgi:hypothetical protein
MATSGFDADETKQLRVARDIPSMNRNRRAIVLATVAVWIPLVIQADVGAGESEQRFLGLLSWLLLLALLRQQESGVQAQVLAAVAFATLIEYTASPLLRLYVYRLENVPSFVPPGHGLIYLAALLAGGADFTRRYARMVRWTALSACGAWVVWGLTFSSRLDTLGATLFLIFGVCMIAGRQHGVYAAAFVVTTYLELVGTALGSWTWSAHDPANLFSIGNPPSGIAGGYCVIDWVGLRGGQVLLRRLRSWRGESLEQHGRDADDARQESGDLSPTLAPVA